MFARLLKMTTLIVEDEIMMQYKYSFAFINSQSAISKRVEKFSFMKILLLLGIKIAKSTPVVILGNRTQKLNASF